MKLLRIILCMTLHYETKVCKAKRTLSPQLTEEKIKKTRLIYDRGKYKECSWWRMLQNPNIADPNHRDGKLFRRRFRTNYRLFLQIKQMCQLYLHKELFTGDHDEFGRECVPFDLKLL